MSIKNITTSLLLFAFTFSVAQETQTTVNDTVKIKEVKISYLDSIKKTFVNDEMASCIESRWAEELVSLDVYNDLLKDIQNINIDEKVDYELPTELLKERLKRLDEKSPFNIEYNIGLENVIKSFLKNRKRGFERLMGVSQFYFPIFEEELAKNNIPLEIKYLAVVESALNPKAVSRVGATGLWQFMYQTGKQYDLDISSYVDERSDPLKSSQAAAKYMTNMYQIFGDWDLVLAAYNSGPGNVSKAIRRSGGLQNYWNIRKHLPKETQGYLPAFLATMYIFEYHKEHGIVPNKAIANHFATDTIMVKKHMTFKQISDLLDISQDEIKFFNPSYKRNEVPYVTGSQNYLRLPKNKIAIFTSNEDKIYAYIKYQEGLREKPYTPVAVSKTKDSTSIAITELDNKITTRTRYYKVKRGDNLSEIAAKYDVSIDDLKKWNRLRSNTAPRGKNLKILTTENIAYKEKQETQNNVLPENAIAENISPEPIVEKKYKTEKITTLKEVTKYYKVKKGDNLSEIASKHDVDVTDLKKWNRIKGNNIQLGDNLKIVKTEKVVTTIKKEVKQTLTSKKEAQIAQTKEIPQIVEQPKKETVYQETKKTTEVVIPKDGVIQARYYTVEKGETIYAVAKKHNVSTSDIMRWNDLKDNNLKAGSQIILFEKSDNIEKTVAKTNKNTFKTEEYTIQKGDNLGTIAKKYNTTTEQLKEWNNLSSNNLQVGQTIITSKQEVAQKEKDKKIKEKIYQVRRGDTLYSICQKFPGITIDELKKWNNIKNEGLKPGMKLKING
jgi:membrane-bound lytic murein transglycosylase D